MCVLPTPETFMGAMFEPSRDADRLAPLPPPPPPPRLGAEEVLRGGGVYSSSDSVEEWLREEPCITCGEADVSSGSDVTDVHEGRSDV